MTMHPMPKTRLHSMSETQREQLIMRLQSTLGAHPNVVFAYLYGSFAEGFPFHDIDVGVCLAHAPASKATELGLELSATFSELMGLPVDVRVLNYAPVPFAYHVLRGRLLADRDPDTRSRITENVVARYLDIRPLLRQAAKEAFAV